MILTSMLGWELQKWQRRIGSSLSLSLTHSPFISKEHKLFHKLWVLSSGKALRKSSCLWSGPYTCCLAILIYYPNDYLLRGITVPTKEVLHRQDTVCLSPMRWLMLLSSSTAKSGAPQKHTDVQLMIVSSKTRMTIMIMIMVICKCSQSDSFPPKYISAHKHKELDLCECCLGSIFLHGCLRSAVIFFCIAPEAEHL